MTEQDITISQGDHLDLSWPHPGDVSSSTFRFRVRKPGSNGAPLIDEAVTGVHGGGVTALALTLTDTNTTLPVGRYGWSLRRTEDGYEETLAKGMFIVEWTADLP